MNKINKFGQILHQLQPSNKPLYIKTDHRSHWGSIVEIDLINGLVYLNDMGSINIIDIENVTSIEVSRKQIPDNCVLSKFAEKTK